MAPIRSLSSWILDKIWSVVVVFVVLWLGIVLVERFQEIKHRGQIVIQIKSIESLVKDMEEKTRTDAQARIKQLDESAREQIERRIQALKEDIQQLSNQLPSPMERTLAVARGEVKTISGWAGKEVSILAKRGELDILAQILEYRLKLDEYERWMREGPAELERVRLEHIADLSEITQLNKEIDQLTKTHPYLVNFPLSSQSKELVRLRGLRDDKSKHTHQLKVKHDELSAFLRMLQRPKHPGMLLHNLKIGAILEDLHTVSGDLEAKLKQDWFWQLINHDFSTTDLVKSAVIIVAVAAMTAFGIKLVLFYVLAPIATRRQPLALLPESGGCVLTGDDLPSHTSTATSSVSCRVTIDSSNELLVHPEYLQSLPTACETRTQWILNHFIPLSSIAAGLCALTRIRTETQQTVVVSSTRDPLSEVALMTIPFGSSLVLLPRHVVGVLQTRGEALLITRHWCLFSLHAWLTLQFRYLVFHGPVTLVVKGCRGVRVEAAEAGRSLNPAATMGFSANLHYASRRCETLFGYVSGQQPLLNDSFAGGSGYYIYQEIPNQRRGGFLGRGLEGVLDAVLKPLGI